MRVSTLLVCAPFAATALAANCTRSLLKNATDAYVSAQSAGSISDLSNLVTTDLNYTENAVATNFSSGVLTIPMKLDHNRSFHDAVECRTFTELIVTDPAAPYVTHTRMIVNATNGLIKKIESVVTKPGDWAFNATGYLYWDSTEDWDIIPADKRDSRDVIKAAGDAYFNVWMNMSVVVPLNTPCARLEGGAYTGEGNLTADTCDIGGYPYGISVPYREYVIDEDYGIVDIFDGFPELDRGDPTYPAPDSHLFRVNSGLIRYIHTVSHCKTFNCGLNSTAPP